MANITQFIFSYYKHDNGFGYDSLTIEPIPGVGGVGDFRLRPMGTRYDFTTLENLAEKLNVRSRHKTVNPSEIIGYINMVTDDARRFTKNPVPLSAQENKRLVDLLNK